MTTKELKQSEFNTYYSQYIDKLSNIINLIEGFKDGKDNVLQFFQSIPSEKLNYRYAEDKWSIKEIFQHLIDTERIFMHRCFRIARHDETALAGYDQNIYIEPSQANNKSIESLIEEFKAVRQNSIILLQSLRLADLEFIGNANDSNMSARAAAFTVIGHYIWHIDVIKERYL